MQVSKNKTFIFLLYACGGCFQILPIAKRSYVFMPITTYALVFANNPFYDHIIEQIFEGEY